MVLRYIQDIIQQRIGDKKVVVLLGARQVGKTSMLKNIVLQKENTVWLNADNAVVKTLFENFSLASFSSFVGNAKLVVIDEAQQLPDIGIKLKQLYDEAVTFQIIVTGSSAFELKNKTNEPLTGRKWEYHLYPFSFAELTKNSSVPNEVQALETRLLFGCYPEIVTNAGDEKERLQTLTDSYLYKDVLMWQGLQKPEKIIQLLKVLALQIGSEVNYNELGKQLQLSNDTIEKYITILEQTFVIFRLPSYSTNLKKELTKGKKIYFFDNGIRNALIGDYRPVAIRQDIGALWENYIISELWKKNSYENAYGTFYFWRTADQQEVDLIIDKNGTLHTYEIKWNPKAKARLSKTFSGNYPNYEFAVIHKENYWEYLI
jgi:predicted AAA+ superfamily ATPase